METKWWQTVLAYWNAAPHWVTALVLAFVGAGYNYLDTIPASALWVDLSTKAGLVALLKGFAVAGLGGLMLLVKQSWVQVPSVYELKLRRAAARINRRGFVRLSALLFVLGLAMMAVGVGGGIVLLAGATIEACTPAQQAEGFDITAVVLKGLLNGEALPAIEQDVIAALRALDASVLDIDIAAAVEDTIQVILDLHLLPDTLIPQARMRMHEAHVGRKVVTP